MLNLMVWCTYGIFVGSIAKSIVPGEENFGFIKTVALGVAGSYVGGALLYLLGQYATVNPASLIMGIVGSIVTLVVYNKVIN